jgi:hypothetical protein
MRLAGPFLDDYPSAIPEAHSHKHGHTSSRGVPSRSIALADLAGVGPRCYPIIQRPGPAFGRPEDKLRPVPMVGTGPRPPVPCEGRSELATLSVVTPEWIEKRLAALPD